MCALPLHPPGALSGTPLTPVAINVNTAPAPVLMTLTSGISNDLAAGAVQARAQQPFQNVAQLTQLLGNIAIPAGVPAPQTFSNWFRLSTQVTIGSAQLTMYSLLYRTGTGATIAVRRSFGTL